MKYACNLLGGMFPARIEPVATAYDEQPEVLEEGRRTATQRAAEIRSNLARMQASGEPFMAREDVIATYEVARSLVTDLCAVIMEDAVMVETAQRARAWIDSALSRAIARGAGQN